MALLLLFFQLVRVGLRSGELFLLQQGILHRVNSGDLRAVKSRKVSGTKAVLRHSATREKTITVLRSCICGVRGLTDSGLAAACALPLSKRRETWEGDEKIGKVIENLYKH